MRLPGLGYLRKYSEDQPRDEAGRWTDAGGGSGGGDHPTSDTDHWTDDGGGQAPGVPTGSRIGAGRPGLSDTPHPEAEAVARFSEKVETGYIIDRDGNATRIGVGDAGSITLTEAERAQIAGATFTHNHPEGGGTLSMSDIGSAARDGAAEIRSIGFDERGGRILSRAWPGPNGWPPAEALYRAGIAYWRNEYLNLIPDVRAKRLTPEQATERSGRRALALLSGHPGLAFNFRTVLLPTPRRAAAPPPRTKYSEDQPRDENGRWTDEGGGAGPSGGDHLTSDQAAPTAAPAAPADRPRGPGRPGLSDTPHPTAEGAARFNARLERGYLIDATGKAIPIGRGDATGVSMNAAEAKLVAGATFTHNHPTGGGTLSLTDVATAARYGAAEVRSIGYHEDGSRMLSRAWPGPKGWPSPEEITSIGRLYMMGEMSRNERELRRGLISTDAACERSGRRTLEELAYTLGFNFRTVHLSPRRRAAAPTVKYSDDQPRDEAGRWTDAGSGGGASDKPGAGSGDHHPTSVAPAATPSSNGPRTAGPGVPGLSDTPHVYELEKLPALYEAAHLIGADGTAQPVGMGLVSAVMFTPEELATFRGATLTHNHPGGIAFSDTDVLMAERYGLAEIRVIGRDFETGQVYLYRAYPRDPEKGWPRGRWPTSPDIAMSFSELGEPIRRRYADQVRRGQISPRAALMAQQHEANTAVADRMGYVYRRIPL